MREGRSPTYSFNFGIGGMNLPESAYVLEQVLNTKPRNLKWVFIELTELQTEWSRETLGSWRALYWHDWKRTSLVLRKIMGAGTGSISLPNLKQLDGIADTNTRTQLIFHVVQFEKNLANLARASDIFDHVLRPDVDNQSANYLGVTGDGYVPRTKKEMSAAQTADYERALALMMEENGQRFISPYAMEACRQCAEKVRLVGAVPIFLITPITKQFSIAADYNAAPPGVVMAFNDPHAYPKPVPHQRPP